MVDSNFPRKFGKYLLLDHIADGGMAKILRAKTLSGNADKIVTIKIIQPQHNNDESFRKMFHDEINVTFAMIHQNIAQTYDYGEVDGQLYTALEYVDGKNLKQFIEKLRGQRYVFPVEISVYIISQICQGLHYAHTLTDKLTGKSANIIHRDISPHNIMISYDGAVKIIDFGIAKSEINPNSTQAGTIKGKLSYMAPEYLEGYSLEASYDQFATGITLWELLCNKKLFQAENDLAVLKQIQKCEIPLPSQFNKNISRELEEIVLTALHKDRTKRFKNMDQFNRALVKFLYSNYSDFNPTDLAYFARELFKTEIKEDREKLFRYGKLNAEDYNGQEITHKTVLTPGIPTGPGNKILSGQSTDRSENSNDKDKVDATQKRKIERMFDFGFEGEKTTSKTKTGPSNASVQSTQSSANNKKNESSNKDVNEKSDNNAQIISPTASSVLTSGQGSTKDSSKNFSGVNNYSNKTQRTSGAKSSTQKDEDKLKFQQKSIGIIILVLVILFLVFDRAGVFKKLGFGKDSLSNDSSALSSTENDVELHFEGVDTYKQNVFVNGSKVNVSVLGDVVIPRSKKIIVRVESPNKDHFVKVYEIRKDVKKFKIEVPTLNEARFGYLMTSSGCINGKLFFTLYNEERVENIPFASGTRIAFPLGIRENGEIIPRKYEIYYQKNNEDIQRKVSFTIKHVDDMVDFCELIETY